MRALVSFVAVALFTVGVRADDPPKPKGSIGVKISAETGSVVVVEAVPGSPAEKAGIKAGDVIVKIDDHKVKEKDATNDDLTEMVKEVAKHEPGSKIKVTVKRDDKEKTIEVTVGKPGEVFPKDKD